MKFKTLFLIIGFFVSLAHSQETITVDPRSTQQILSFGGDAKLTIKKFAENDTDKIAENLFSDINLDMIRVPYYTLQPISDSINDKIIKVIKAVKAQNPDIKVYISIGNGDGYDENNLHRGEKFPEEWKCCRQNVYNLDLDAYGAFVNEFVQRLQSEDVNIDVLGVWNEDKARYNDYEQVFNQIENVDSMQKIGLESYALQTAINRVNNLDNLLDIIGAHFYDDVKIPYNRWEEKWRELVDKTEKPVWFTESTRAGINDSISNLLNGLEHMFPAINGGVEKVILYQVYSRLVFKGGGKKAIKYSGFRNFVNNASNLVVTSTTSNDSIRTVAVTENNTLNIHVLNRKKSEQQTTIQLDSNFLVNGTVKEKTWSINSSNWGTVEKFDLENTSNFSVTLPADSYVHYQFELTSPDPVLNVEKPYGNTADYSVLIDSNTIDITLSKSLQNNSIADIEMYTINGTKIYSDSFNTKDTKQIQKNMPNGIYILTISTGGFTKIEKIILNN